MSIFRLSRQGRATTQSPQSYYPSQESCQIPNLSFLFERFLGARESGTYVEVGAYDGIFASNTWGLAERGWTGLMIEPVPKYAKQCRKNYKRYPRVSVLPQGIGAPGVTEIEIAVAGTLSSAAEKAREEVSRAPWAKGVDFSKKVRVPASSLDETLESHFPPPHLDVLVVDVEGYETEVFSGFNLNKYKPRMIIVELLDTHPDLSAHAHLDGALGLQLSQNGYVTVFKDKINTVFVDGALYSQALEDAVRLVL